MSIRKHIWLSLFIVLFLLPAGKGAAVAILPDTASIHIRLPDSKHIADYRKQKAFDYEYKEGNYSFQNMIQRWMVDKIGRLFKLFNHAGSVELFLIILIALAILAIILKINDINPIALFRGKNRVLHPVYETGKVDITQLDYPVFINQAISRGNYRLAVRFQYLQTLALLAAAGKIKPGEEKTNREYLLELGNDETRIVFARLVYGFEFIWYGEFVPDEMQYHKLSAAFNEFQKSLAE